MAPSEATGATSRHVAQTGGLSVATGFGFYSVKGFRAGRNFLMDADEFGAHSFRAVGFGNQLILHPV